MTDRQYGVVPGTGIHGTPPPPYLPPQRNRRSHSPLKQETSPYREAQQTPSPSRQPYAQISESRNHAQPARSDHIPDQEARRQAPPPPVHRTLATQAPFIQPGPEELAISSVTTSEISSFSPQDSRSRALQDVDNLYSPRLTSPSPERDTYFNSPYRDETPRQMRNMPERRAPNNSIPPMAPAYMASPTARASTPSLSSPHAMSRASYYQGDGYDDLDPDSIADDPDDIFRDPPPRSRSRLSLGRPFAAGAAGTMAGAAAQSGPRDASGKYQAVSTSNIELPENRYPEKSTWLEEQDERKRKRKRLLIILGIILLVGIVVGAVVGGIFASRRGSTGGGTSSSSTTGGSSTSSSSDETHSGGVYDLDSEEVQAVLNNRDLHKVFPGMDYTPMNAQYPYCLHDPPDQNNITLDVAVLSQLTPAIRLYGTDCGQTEMVLSAIDSLKMNDTMQVWLGVWLGNNATTNTRQISQMYDLLDKYPTSHFAGIIIGNEVLFREDMTLYELGQTLTNVRANLTAKRISLPLATSDLGDDWTAGLAATSDIVMANIHPFFAGVTPDKAAGWTWNFWQTRNSMLAPARTGSWPKSIVSEVGWPSEGGNNCGTGTASCPSGQGAVASVDNMNIFMEDYVCPSLSNGTTFFWFSAFDEPWKAMFDTANDQWESKWGLMDVNRNLKSGLSIPDCGGTVLSKAY